MRKKKDLKHENETDALFEHSHSHIHTVAAAAAAVTSRLFGIHIRITDTVGFLRTNTLTQSELYMNGLFGKSMLRFLQITTKLKR